MSSHLVYLIILAPALLLIEGVEVYTRSRRATWIAAIVCMLAMIPAGIWWAREVPPPPDGYLASDYVPAYYPAGRQVVEAPKQLYEADPPIKGFVNLPIIAYAFTPLAKLDRTTSCGVFTAIGLITIVAIILLLPWIADLGGIKRALLRMLVLVNGPLDYNLQLGNTSSFCLLLLIFAVAAFGRRRDVLAGFWVAVAALIKLPLLLIGAFFFLRAHWRAWASLTATCLITFAMSVAIFGTELHVRWFKWCILGSSTKPIAAFNVQSIDGFVARLATDGLWEKWIGVDLPPGLKVLKYALLLAILTPTLLILWRAGRPRNSEQFNTEFSIALCLSLIISPISWTHYYCMLLLPIAMWMGGKLQLRRGAITFLLMAAATVLITTPVVRPRPAMVADELREAIFLSLPLYGGLLMLAALIYGRTMRSKAEA